MTLAKRKVYESNWENSCEKEWHVEEIKGHRLNNSIREWEVKWVGYEETTWEPIANLSNCLSLLNDYLEKNYFTVSFK